MGSHVLSRPAVLQLLATDCAGHTRVQTIDLQLLQPQKLHILQSYYPGTPTHSYYKVPLRDLRAIYVLDVSLF